MDAWLNWVLLPVAAFVLGWLLQRQWSTIRSLEVEKRWRGRLEQEVERRSAAEQTAKRVPELEESLERCREQIRWLSSSCGQLEVKLKEEQRSASERIALLKETEERLGKTFKALSSEVLQNNNQAFLDLAKTNLEKFQESARTDLGKRQEAIDQMVKPVKDSLTRFETKMVELEQTRAEANASLKQQINSLFTLQNTLQQETNKIATALKSSSIRGRWGEMQLRRIVELAGMVEHCDFVEQPSVDSEEGKRRPDMVVNLPEGRQIVVDAKAPLEAYLEACEVGTEADRKPLLQKHANAVRQHIRLLSNKRYTEHFEPSPEFVVLFLPGEPFFSAALREDPTLIEMGAKKGVILATPTTLISLLRAVCYGWRHQALSHNAEKISEVGSELYKRLSVLGQHWAKLGRSLNGAVHAYNDAVGSIERRVMVKAREFEKLDATKGQSTMDVLSPIDQRARELQAPELVEVGETD